MLPVASTSDFLHNSLPCKSVFSPACFYQRLRASIFLSWWMARVSTMRSLFSEAYCSVTNICLCVGHGRTSFSGFGYLQFYTAISAMRE